MISSISFLLYHLVISIICIPVRSFHTQSHYSNGFNASVDLKLSKLNDDGFLLKISDSSIYNFKRKKELSSIWLANEDFWLRKEKSSMVDLYEDASNGASVMIENDTEVGGFKISGFLDVGKVLSPLDGGVVTRGQCTECLPVIQHEVQYTTDNDANDAPDKSDYEQVEAEYPRARRGKSLKGKVHPEILILVDYFLYEKLNYDKERTEKYIVSFVNAVNLRFKSIHSPSIELYIAGVIIAETKAAFSFITENIEKNNMIDAASTLNDMGRYFYKDRADLPIYDIVITMTGLDMTRKKGGRRIKATSGYAYVGGACIRNAYLKKISSVALVEDSGGYSGVVVTAHEIGHLLGAVHDGDKSPSYLRGPGAKSCPWSAGYIMSDLRHTSRGQQWSDCSVKQIKYFLKTSAAQCLYNPPPRNNDYSLPGDNKLPGSSISLDDQCRKDKGTKACWHDQRVCAQLFCYTKNYSGCYAYRPAVEGSYCGKGKMCINGKCTKRTSTQRNTKTSHYNYFMEDQTVQSNSVTDATTRVTSVTTVRSTTSRLTTTSTTTIVTTTATGPELSTRRKIENNENEDSREVMNNNSSTKNKKKSFITRMPKQHEETSNAQDLEISSNCRDSIRVLSSLTCTQLFQRYAFHYCKNNRVIKKKCCVSYHKFCRAPGSSPR